MMKNSDKKITADNQGEALEKVADNLDEIETQKEDLQAGSSTPFFAKKSDESTKPILSKDPQDSEIKSTTSTKQQNDYAMKTESKSQKTSGGKSIALFALLVALSIGSAGYYFGTQKLNNVDLQLTELAKKIDLPISPLETPNFDSERKVIADLTSDYQKMFERINQLEQDKSVYLQQINGLQSQLNKIGASSRAEPNFWLMSEADFLLNNALRKLVLDNDIDTTESLLKEADRVLTSVSDPKVLIVRNAIKMDLEQLANVNDVDQNGIMQSLSLLANNIDELSLVDAYSIESTAVSNEVSGSVSDWQQNIEKSASSFLDHFIRIRERNGVEAKVLLAPNQEIYLRENIRLRLQIAILAIPRQQNELYKQSLDIVSTWIRSYFDVQSDNVKQFLRELDNLAEQSIYVDAPARLQSLTLLDELLHKESKPLEKIELEVEKALAEEMEEPLKEQKNEPVIQLPTDAVQVDQSIKTNEAKSAQIKPEEQLQSEDVQEKNLENQSKTEEQ